MAAARLLSFETIFECNKLLSLYNRKFQKVCRFFTVGCGNKSGGPRKDFSESRSDRTKTKFHIRICNTAIDYVRMLFLNQLTSKLKKAKARQSH
jgi:hypothetical protein